MIVDTSVLLVHKGVTGDERDSSEFSIFHRLSTYHNEIKWNFWCHKT